MGYELSKREDLVKRSNLMINSSYQSSLFAKQITALAIARMKAKDEELVAELPVGEVKEALGLKGSSIYTEIKGVSIATLGQKLMIEDPDSERFYVFNVFSSAAFSKEDATLRLKFTNDVKKHTIEIKDNYTIMRLATLVSFSSNHAYRLYELLKTHEFKIPKAEGASYSFKMDILDFRFRIGLVNTSKEYIQDMMDAGEPLDVVYKAALERANEQRRQLKEQRKTFKKSKESAYTEEKPDVLYVQWGDLKKRVLDIAVAEINNSPLCEIHVDYEPIKRGRGAKITEIKFTISRNPKYKNAHEDIGFDLVRPRKSDIAAVEEVRAFIAEPLSEKDVLHLLDAADGEIDKVRYAYELALTQGGIQNLVAWMSKAIKENWTSISVDKKMAENKFNNHEQRDSDMDELEKMLLRTNDNVGKKPEVIDAEDVREVKEDDNYIEDAEDFEYNVLDDASDETLEELIRQQRKILAELEKRRKKK